MIKNRNPLGYLIMGTILAVSWYNGSRSIEDKIIQKREDTYVASFAASNVRSVKSEFYFEDKQTYLEFKRLVGEMERSRGQSLREGDWYDVLVRIDDPNYHGLNVISRHEIAMAWGNYRKEGLNVLLDEQ